MTDILRPPPERRRIERRTNARVMDLTIPELRRMLLTTILFVVVLTLFLWMVRTVIIGTILGIVVAVYLRPAYLRIWRAIRNPYLAATLTILLLVLPVFGLLVYSYLEIANVAAYVDVHSTDIAAKIDLALYRLPFLKSAHTGETVQRWVLTASNYGLNIPNVVKSTLVSLAVAATIFIFTAGYVLVDGPEIVAYIRSKIAPRYSELMAALETNVRGVLYGAIYSTFLTQAIKSLIILVMNVAFRVPLAAVLAMLSFIIGFFPIVGSWSVYLPVALWLLIFRNAPGQAISMLIIGFVVNTMYISTFLRPKIAAERSRVLNFYWMFVGLVTGVYTFGLVGILLGPILIGLLKAIFDTVTNRANWTLLDADGDVLEDGASEVLP
jgi:predicted PurR-regulated permease PerM